MMTICKMSIAILENLLENLSRAYLAALDISARTAYASRQNRSGRRSAKTKYESVKKMAMTRTTMPPAMLKTLLSGHSQEPGCRCLAE